jgi:hypothetical protein
VQVSLNFLSFLPCLHCSSVLLFSILAVVWTENFVQDIDSLNFLCLFYLAYAGFHAIIK